MTRYCAFFESIEVDGHRLSMADLRYAFAREEIDNAETVISNGNVLFDYEDRPTEGLEELFAYMMRERFDMRSFTAVRNREEIRAAAEDNPFAVGGEEDLVHSVLLEKQPAQDEFASLVDHFDRRGTGRLALGNRCLFVACAGGAAEGKVTLDFIGKRLGRGTARDVRSLTRILAKMD